MIKKPFEPYFFFYLALVYIVFSYPAHAAQVVVSDNKLAQGYSAFNDLLGSSQNKKADKVPPPPLPTLKRKKTLPSVETEENSPANTKKNIADLFTAVPEQNSLSVNKVIQAINQPIDVISIDPYDIIKETAKQVLKENKENELLQDSLIILSRTKQHIDEAEEILNGLVRELMAPMESERLVFSNLVTFNQESTPASILIKDESVIQIYNSQPGVKELSGSQNIILESYDDRENKLISLGFLQKIFRINTLFYLLGIMIIFPVIMRIFRFLLFGKYQKSLSE